MNAIDELDKKYPNLLNNESAIVESIHWVVDDNYGDSQRIAEQAVAELAQMQARLAAIEALEKEWHSEKNDDLDYISVVRGCASDLRRALNGEEMKR